MKELSVEQKAKRYDEVIELVNSKWHYRNQPCIIDVSEIFPELKESEDDQHRKWILEYLYDGLRKSDEQFKDQFKCAIAWLEKQGELKPADKVEPKFKVKYAGSEYNVLDVKDIAGVTFYGIEDEPNHIDYVKADNCEIISGYGIKENGSSYPTKPAMFSEQKHAWSVEDMSKVQRICKYLNEAKKYYADITEVRECIDWLKSLKRQSTTKGNLRRLLL